MNSSLLPLDILIEGDCLEVLDTLPEGSVDVVFADPPYNLQLRNDLWRPNQTLVDAVRDDWDQFKDFAAYDDFTRRWLMACRRVLKDTGTLWVIGTYHNIYRVGAILQDLGYWILNDIVWIKSNPMPNFRGVRFTNAHETILWAQKKAGARYTFHHHAMKALNEDLQMRSDWYLPLCSGKERLRVNGVKVHATQKPQGLLYRVLLASTNPGDVVLDPFFGSGTTGVVAQQLDRHWIGIESDPHYIQPARERIANARRNSDKESLFATVNPRRAVRLPFGALLENGLLQPGQILYFGAQGDQTAEVQADGALVHKDKRGSIHMLARHLNNGSCNGWLMWYYEDEQTRQRLPIDTLRQALRALYDQTEKETQ